MKLIAIIFSATCIQVSARGYSRVTLSETYASLQKVFHQIQQQSGYDFVSTYETLKAAGNVTVNVQNVTLQKALEEVLKGKPLAYVIIGKKVVVKEKADYSSSTIIKTKALLPPPNEIQGRVANQQGEPLQNVSVMIAGIKIGTTTGNDGRFSLTAPDDRNIVLEISSVGCQTTKVKVGKQTEINGTLELEVTRLSDVVVIGYGAELKASVTGSIASVSAKNLYIKNVPVTTVGRSLQGKISGVRISQTTGVPGAGLKFQIRRAVSLTAGADPLYVGDGMPITGDISFMDPGEIKSITILKDAAVSGFYGSRAANGVVLVETKTGTVGKIQIDFNAYDEFESISENRHPKVMDVREYAQFENDITVTNCRPVDPLFAKSAQYGKGTNWFDVVTRRGTIQSYNLTLSSGSDRFKVSCTAGYFNQEGVVIGSRFKRYSLHVDTQYQPADKLSK